VFYSDDYYFYNRSDIGIREINGTDRIVNAVGSGAPEVELDLGQLATDIGEPVAKYDPEKYPGMYIRFDDCGALVTLYRTGKSVLHERSNGSN
jgi:TATA-box binding protein (TBP) (component of TFIID and TFIIIB)